MAKVWRARHVTLKVNTAAAVSISAGTKLDESVGFGATGPTTIGNAKNVTIVEPEGSVEKIDLLGVNSDSFQNAELDRKPFGMATISGTLLLNDGETLEPFAFGSPTTVSTNSRWRVGNGTRADAAFLVALNDTVGSDTQEVLIVLDNAVITRMGDIRQDAADGHWEQDFEAMCLPRDFYIEFED